MYNYQIWLLVRNGRCNNLKYTSLGVKTGKATDFCVGAILIFNLISLISNKFTITLDINRLFILKKSNLNYLFRI